METGMAGTMEASLWQLLKIRAFHPAIKTRIVPTTRRSLEVDSSLDLSGPLKSEETVQGTHRATPGPAVTWPMCTAEYIDTLAPSYDGTERCSRQKSICNIFELYVI